MRTVALVLCLSLPAGAALAGEIYRWVDSGGVLHFTEDPPAARPYQRVTPQLPPPTPAPHVDSLRESQRSAEGRAVDTASTTREAGLRLKAETLERCAKARERIGFLQEKTAHRLFKTGPDGQPARYTDEEFQAELGKAKTEAEQNCT